MSVLPKPLPNYTKITHIIKSQEPINENIEVDGKIWYCEQSYFTSDDEFWFNQFFEINSSKQTIKEEE